MPQILMPHVAARIFDTPLMIDAGKAAAILGAIGGRVVEGGVVIAGVEPVEHVAFQGGRPSMGRLGDPLGRSIDPARGLFVLGKVAVIPIEGTLVHKGKFVGQSSGETSYEGLQARIGFARRDERVKGVVFEVDSFGGEVSGAFDTARMMAELSASKPTIAILTDFALSAGYLLAAACRQIVAPSNGRAGSIGVIALHADFSKALEQDGIKVTLLTAGAHKADGNPFEALPKAVADRIRNDLEATRDEFAAAVGRFRGERFTKAAALRSEAQHYRGTDALELGLVDAVGHPAEAFDAFMSEVNRARPGSARGATMTTPAIAAAAAVQTEPAQQQQPQPAPAAQAQPAPDAGKAATVRIKGILESEEANGREDLAKHLAFNTDMSVEAAVATLKASPKSDARSLDMEMRGERQPELGTGAEQPKGPAAIAAAWDAAVAESNARAGFSADGKSQLKH